MNVYIRFVGLVFFLTGAVLFLFGINSSQMFFEKMIKSITGRYTEGTMWYLIGGGMTLVSGAMMFLFRKPGVESKH